MKHNLRRALTIIFIFFIIIFVFAIAKNRQKLINKPSFPKGLLAINTDRQIYLPGETVNIQIASLNFAGSTDCTSNLILEIQGKKDTEVLKSSICGNDNVTNNSDYFVKFKPEKNGVYILKLSNSTSGMEVKNKFIVSNKRDLDIVRESTTKINPSKTDRYPVKFIITASKDYRGDFSDIVPEGFTIPWQGTAKIEGNKITWQLDIKSGETKELIYEYKSPNTAPALYYFGKEKDWQVVSAN